jgi:hypothetical protein
MFKHKNELPREITPNRMDKNGSFSLNFKPIDSTVNNGVSKPNEIRKSYDEAMLVEDATKLPNIKQKSRMDNRIGSYMINYNE